MNECVYLQYFNDNRDFYCTLYNDSEFIHPECACRNCSDYNGGPICLHYAERVESE